MAGTPIRRARKEAAARAAAGFPPPAVYADGMLYTGKVFDVDGNPVMTSAVEMSPAWEAEVQAGLDRAARDAMGGDSTSTSPHRVPTHARTSDHRARLMEVADDCLQKLLTRPDREVSTVYKDAMYLLMKLEAQDKDPTPRPEDVRRGVVDMLAMLPDLCANDDELRTLAVEALARVVEQAEA